jgi:hypothetical protein
LKKTHTEKHTQATKKAMQDGNAKACQAVLDEFTEADEKLKKKLEMALEKLPYDDQATKAQEYKKILIQFS